jgi:two-component sensor histidine kinase
VKNNLQVIESLVSLQIGQSPDREVVKALGETRTRVHGMALVHEQLYDGASLAGVDLGACLEGIAADVAQDRRRAGQDIALRVEAEGLSLSADRALPACLAAAELVANCFDHAFAGRSEGSVALRAVGTGRGGFVLSVEDDGLGAGPGPLREGLGLGIARALSAQLGGELRRERGSAGGERFVLEVRCRD